MGFSYKLAGWAIVMLSLFGCACNHTDQQPVNCDSPSDYLPAECSTEEDLPSTEITWPADLNTLLDIAFSNNPETRLAWQRAKIAEAQKGKAAAVFFPQVKLKAIAANSKDIAGQNPSDNKRLITHESTVFYPQIEITYSLFKFGAHRARAEAAKSELLAANFQYNRALQTLAFSVQMAYFNLDSAKEAVSANQLSLDDAKASLEYAQRRYDSGLGNINDLLKARANLSQAQFQFEHSSANIETARAELARVLGLQVSSQIDIFNPNIDNNIDDALLGQVDDILAKTLECHPHILAAKARFDAATQANKSASRNLMPELIAGFTGSINKVKHYDSNYQKYSAFVGLQWDLFDGFANLNNVIEARARTRAAKHELQAAKLDTAKNVWDQYHKFKSACRQLKAAGEYEKSAKEAFDSIQLAYANGLGSFLDLMTAQNSLASARQKLVASKNGLAISLAALAYAAGNLTINDRNR
ncbi:MAG: TolC family protein [Puniceicoccales bacterium]|nr:TolC family protein [Puniceicoccales bacterium]